MRTLRTSGNLNWLLVSMTVVAVLPTHAAAQTEAASPQSAPAVGDPAAATQAAPPAAPVPRKVRGYLYDSLEMEVPPVCEAAGAAHGAACEDECFVGHAVATCIADRDDLEGMIKTPEDREAADSLLGDCLASRQTTRDLVARCVVACVEQRGGPLCRSVLPGPPPAPLRQSIATEGLTAAREWYLHADATVGALFGNPDPEVAFVPASGRLRVGLNVRGWDFRVGALAQGLSRFALGIGFGKAMDPIRFGEISWMPIDAGLEVYPSAVSFLGDLVTTLRIPTRGPAPYGGQMSWRVSLGITGYLSGYPNEQFLGPSLSVGAELGL